MFKKIINVISVVFLVLIVCFVLFTFVSRIMGNTPSVFGYYIFRVSSDSMEPTLMVGDVILVHKADPEDIQKRFGMSKAAFKRALGRLMKEGKVTQADGWTTVKK